MPKELELSKYMLDAIYNLQLMIKSSVANMDSRMQDANVNYQPSLEAARRYGWLESLLYTTIVPALDLIYSTAKNELEYADASTDNNALSAKG